MLKLTYQTLVSDPLSLSIPSTPFGPAFTSPNTSTLILGEREAVLVDPPLAVEQAVAVADWVASFDRILTFIVSTHGHADHWFGTERVLNRFPDARPVASAATVAMMAVQGSAEFRAQSYDAMLPGQIGDTRVVATPLEGGTLQLEGQDVHLLDMGHSDTDDTSVVHVPLIGLVVGGDVVYNGVHQYLAESASDDALGAWLAAIDRVADLEARNLVAGHKNGELDDDPGRVVRSTREYLRTAQRAWHEQETPEAFANVLVETFPTLLNPTILWLSAQALYTAR